MASLKLRGKFYLSSKFKKFKLNLEELGSQLITIALSTVKLRNINQYFYRNI